MENNRERLSQEIDKCLAGKLDQRESVMICEHTPLILQKLGLQDYPILFSQGHIHNCLHPKGERSKWHGLYKNDLLELPRQLCQPAIIYDSLSNDDSIVVATGTVDDDNLPIIASIRIEGEGQYKFEKINSNYLTSIYGHEHFANIINRSMNENGILYVNKEKTQKLGNLSQLQLLRGLPQIGYEGIIHKSENIVNGEMKPIFDKNKVKEFNQEWKKRNIFIEEKSEVGYSLAALYDNQTKDIFSLINNGEFTYTNIYELVEILKNTDFFLTKEREYKGKYLNGNGIKDALAKDIKYIFAPRKDQLHKFNICLNLVQDMIYIEFMNILGINYKFNKNAIDSSYYELENIPTNKQTKSYSSATRDPIAGSKDITNQHADFKNIDKHHKNFITNLTK